jgi:hypothetical protein
VGKAGGRVRDGGFEGSERIIEIWSHSCFTLGEG